MKNFLQKKPMLLLCALLLFSLGCMGVLAVAEPKGTGSTAETVEMTEGAVPLAGDMEEVSEATSSNARTVTLIPGDGTLEGSNEIKVDKETGKIQSSLPDPTRKGWTFVGWYTEKGIEKLITGGYSTTAGDPAPLGDDKELVGRLQKELEDAGKDPAAVKQMTEEEVLKMLNHWLILPKGKNVTDTVPEDVEYLYAVYKPISYTVAYHENGWKGRTAVFSTGAQYGAPISSYNLNTRDPWTGHTLEGWSRKKNGGSDDIVMYEKSEKGDTIYIIGEYPLEIPESGTTIDLYAVGTVPKVTDVSVYLQKSDTRHGSDGWHMTLRYTLSPSSEQETHVTWSVDRNDIAMVEVDNKERYQATLTIWDRNAINEKTPVTVTVTSDNGVSGSFPVEVAHDWYETYSSKPNCKRTGFVTYRCDSCGRSWTETLDKTEHRFSYHHTAATCTEEGFEERECSDCGLKEITKIEPATGHSWGAVQVVSGCGGAVKTKTCTVCGFTETDVDANDAAHQWNSEMTIDKAPTCFEAGSRSYHCAVCGLTKGSETIPANPDLHRWTGWTVDKKPQIGVMGQESRRCLTCKDVETRDIEALLPTVDSEANKAPAVDDSSIPTDDAAGDSTPENVPDNPPAEVPTSPSTSGSSSGGSSGGGGGSRGSSGGGGGGGGGSRSSSGGGAAKTGAGPSAGAAATPLPVVPTAEIRAALPTYVEVGTWDKAADGTWTCKDENGQPYTNRWAAVYNPYANTAAADAFDWFRFDAAGHLIIGLYVDPVDGNTYYMNPASDGTQGKMMTGWQWIDGKEYYFNPNSDGQKGRMYRNEETPDGHFVGPDGAKVK